MLALAIAPTGPANANFYPQARIQAVAELGLRSSPYPALKAISCEYQGGVLVLRGCLPTYYLKQMAQEVVAHQCGTEEQLENRIQVVQPSPR